VANKLAGQKAKFTKALADYNSTENEATKDAATRRMLEVLHEAPGNGFSETAVTGGRDVPLDVQRQITRGEFPPKSPPEDPDQLVRQLEQRIDASDLHEEGAGNQTVYAYGYRCAPDRLKVGRCDGDVIGRVTSQISTSTPDKPVLFLVIRTHDCRALEMAMHGVLRLKRRKITGGGDEWYLTTRDELLAIYKSFLSSA
jgi:Meiotically up-regulated gene 113